MKSGRRRIDGLEEEEACKRFGRYVDGEQGGTRTRATYSICNGIPLYSVYHPVGLRCTRAREDKGSLYAFKRVWQNSGSNLIFSRSARWR